MAPQNSYALTLLATFSRPSIFVCILVALWLPFGTPLAPLGSLWASFGSLLAPFGLHWGGFGSILAPFCLHFVKFGDLSGRFGLILVTTPIKRMFLVTPLLKVMFSGIDFARHSQIRKIWFPKSRAPNCWGHLSIKNLVSNSTEGNLSHYPLLLGPGADPCRRQLRSAPGPKAPRRVRVRSLFLYQHSP